MAYFRDVVGIDVSKQNLDLYVLSGQQRRTVANTAAGYGDLVSWLKSLGVRMAVMEASGGYERDSRRCGKRDSTCESSIPSGSVTSPKRPGGWPRMIVSTPR